MTSDDKVWRSGGRHCGAVRFEARLPAKVEAQSCNCSICERIGFVHVIVPESRFRLIQGQDRLTSYSFNTKHLFCQVCGVKSFYRPRSNPDGWSINARCLDPENDLNISIFAFDGRNWEAHAAALAHLSQA
jgi:hypothetical protein